MLSFIQSVMSIGKPLSSDAANAPAAPFSPPVIGQPIVPMTPGYPPVGPWAYSQMTSGGYQEDEDFRERLCSCGDEYPCALAMESFFLPWCQLARQRHVILGEGSSPFSALCAALFLVDVATVALPFIFPFLGVRFLASGLCIQLIYTRRSIRGTYGLRQNTVNDYCVGCLLPCFATMQQHREMNRRQNCPGSQCGPRAAELSPAPSAQQPMLFVQPGYTAAGPPLFPTMYSMPQPQPLAIYGPPTTMMAGPLCPNPPPPSVAMPYGSGGAYMR